MLSITKPLTARQFLILRASQGKDDLFRRYLTQFPFAWSTLRKAAKELHADHPTVGVYLDAGYISVFVSAASITSTEQWRVEIRDSHTAVQERAPARLRAVRQVGALLGRSA